MFMLISVVPDLVALCGVGAVDVDTVDVQVDCVVADLGDRSLLLMVPLTIRSGSTASGTAVTSCPRVAVSSVCSTSTAKRYV